MDSGEEIRQFGGALFDLDGVLVDSRPAIVALWRGIAREHTRELDDAAIRRYVLGCAAEYTVASLFGDLPTWRQELILDGARAADAQLAFVEIPGAWELVSRVRAAGIPAALVTGASAVRAAAAIRQLDLAGAFRAVVAWGDVAEGKPAPDCYLLAAKRIGLPTAHCVVFEDAPSGIRAAAAAGAASIGIGPADELASSGATWTIPDIHALRHGSANGGVDLYVRGGAHVRLTAAATAGVRSR